MSPLVFAGPITHLFVPTHLTRVISFLGSAHDKDILVMGAATIVNSRQGTVRQSLFLSVASHPGVVDSEVGRSIFSRNTGNKNL